MIAMDCLPTAATIRDDGLRWGIEPMFADFKTRGFGLEDTPLRDSDRVDHFADPEPGDALVHRYRPSRCLGIANAAGTTGGSTNRSQPLALSQARPLLSLLVSTGTEKTPAVR